MLKNKPIFKGVLSIALSLGLLSIPAYAENNTLEANVKESQEQNLEISARFVKSKTVNFRDSRGNLLALDVQYVTNTNGVKSITGVNAWTDSYEVTVMSKSFTSSSAKGSFYNSADKKTTNVTVYASDL